MFHSDIEIKEGAFVITDAHYSHLRPHLFDFLNDIYLKNLNPTQLIFLGDIFDALFGGVKKSITNNEEIIILLNKISTTIELIYLEGNHDFNLSLIFPNARVFSMANQPLYCKYKEKRVILAHGDFHNGFWYKVYSKIVRNKIVLYMLDFLNRILDNTIFDILDSHLNKKDDCKDFIGFEGFIKDSFNDKFSCDYFIEGHYHQNKTIELKNFIYMNLGAFACNQRYFIVKSLEDKKFLEENIYSKRI